MLKRIRSAFSRQQANSRAGDLPAQEQACRQPDHDDGCGCCSSGGCWVFTRRLLNAISAAADFRQRSVEIVAQHFADVSACMLSLSVLAPAAPHQLFLESRDLLAEV